MIKVVLDKLDKVLMCVKGETILEVLRRNEIQLGCSCNGESICCSCIVEILDGQNNLSSSTHRSGFLRKDKLNKNYRLACATKILGDIRIKTDYW